jgi:hypothetical protein
VNGKIVQHYVLQAVKESYKVLGAADFLGNPVPRCA